MATIPELPSRAIIDGMKGALDFYLYRGTAVVRMWPRAPTGPRTEAVMVGANKFSYINKLASSIPPVIREAYERAASGTGLTWRDYLVRAYISGIDY